MAAVNAGTAPATFDLKSASLPLVALVLKSADLGVLAADLQQRYGDAPDFFEHDAVVVDLSRLEPAEAAAEGAEPDSRIDFAELLPLLRRYRLVPVAVKGGDAATTAAALAAGLADAAQATAEPAVREVVKEVEVVREVVRDVVREVPVAAGTTAVVVDKPLRSGQQVYAKGGDLVVLAMVSFGAEVIADGHIHVYAPLRGRAIAGARGNVDARIFTTHLEPELISIAGTYRTSDTPLPADVAGKPAQIRLVGDKLVMEPLEL